MKTVWIYGIPLMVLAMVSCTPAEKPIQFGTDVCTYCKMTIVDKQHAAEVVTKKGRAYKFDAIECMLQDRTHDPEEIAIYLVMDFSEPGHFIDATRATFLISQNLPSPMGAYLSGFNSEQEAFDLKKRETGEIYSWAEIQEKFMPK